MFRAKRHLRSECDEAWLVGDAFREQGYGIDESLDGGADGGVDLRLLKDGKTSLVQCKRWKSKKVPVTTVRELFGVMCAESAQKAIVVCTSQFTKDAEEFARANSIRLIDGEELLVMIGKINSSRNAEVSSQEIEPHSKVIAHSTSSVMTSNTPTRSEEYTKRDPAREAHAKEENPVCSKCGDEMVLRTAKKGKNAGQKFWGCKNFPRCRYTVGMEFQGSTVEDCS